MTVTARPAVVTSLDVTGAALGFNTPTGHGFVAWTCDPAFATAGSTQTAGSVYLAKMTLPGAKAVTKLYWHINTVAVTPTADQNEVGVYSIAGTRLAAVNVDAVTTATGLKSTTIAPGLLAAGEYWAAFVFNAGTTPGLARTGSVNTAALLNANLATAVARGVINGTSQTVLPATVTPGSGTTQASVLWAAFGL